MSNPALHEIYNPYSRTFSFAYVAIMRDKRNEIVEKIINNLKKELKSKERELKGYKKISENDLIFPKSPKIWEQKNKREMYKRGRK